MKNGDTHRFLQNQVKKIKVIENYPQSPDIAVDLGLSVKWAPHNIGAMSPLEHGNCYTWGSVIPCEGKLDELSHCITGIDFENVDINPTVRDKFDVAKFEWGNDWRVPSIREMQELIDKCEWKYKDIMHNEIIKGGYYEICGPSGNTIYLPTISFPDSFRNTWASFHDVICLWTDNVTQEKKCSSLLAYHKLLSTKNKIVERRVIEKKEYNRLCNIRAVLNK